MPVFKGNEPSKSELDKYVKERTASIDDPYEPRNRVPKKRAKTGRRAKKR